MEQRKIAVMQPYLFPYIGYWQLIRAADIFIILDDVNYIKRGWINRNRIVCDGKEQYFVLPVKHASQNRRITEHEFLTEGTAFEDLLKTFRHAYRDAPFREQTMALLEPLLHRSQRNLADYLEHSIREICVYLGIATPVFRASRLRDTAHGKGQEGIVELVRRMDGTDYINPKGGRSLYDPKFFQEQGIRLHFLETDFDRLSDLTGDRQNDLSVVDLLFRYSPQSIRQMLEFFSLK